MLAYHETVKEAEQNAYSTNDDIQPVETLIITLTKYHWYSADPYPTPKTLQESENCATKEGVHESKVLLDKVLELTKTRFKEDEHGWEYDAINHHKGNSNIEESVPSSNTNRISNNK